MRLFLILIAVCLIAARHATADETKFTQSHIDAAGALLKAMNMESHLSDSFEVLLRDSLPENIARTTLKVLDDRLTEDDYQEAEAAFFNAYLESGVEITLTYTAEIYASHFTEEELRVCTLFYSSDVGQKVLQNSPVIAKKVRDTIGKAKKIDPDLDAGVFAMLKAVGIPFEDYIDALNAEKVNPEPED